MGSVSKYRWLIEIAIRILEALIFTKGERGLRQIKRTAPGLRE